MKKLLLICSLFLTVACSSTSKRSNASIEEFNERFPSDLKSPIFKEIDNNLENKN